MDPLSISANVVGIAMFCGSVAQKVGRFVVDTADVPDALSDFYETINALHAALVNIAEVLQQRPHQLSFELSHHQNISQIIKSCKKALERLDKHLPTLANKPTPTEKVRMSLLMSLKSNTIRQTVVHIHSYTQVLQISLFTLTLGSLWGAQKSQGEIQAQIRALTAKIHSLNCDILGSDDTPGLFAADDPAANANLAVTREIQEWRKTADDVAAAVSLYDADQASLQHSSSSGCHIASDSGIDMGYEFDVDCFDPEPNYKDCPSREILQCQLEQNQKMVDQLVRSGIFIKASSYQRKGIARRVELCEQHSVDFPYEEHAGMKEFLADILLHSETHDGVQEAKEILKGLLTEECNRGGGKRDELRRSRLYHKLGTLYMRQQNLEQARKLLSRAVEARKKIQPMPTELVLESAEMLVQALQLDQAYDEARGYREWMRRELRSKAVRIERAPSTAIEAQLSSMYAWCKERGFNVDFHDFRFDSCDPGRGTSPMHLAVQEQNLRVVRQMLDHGVSLEHSDGDLATPLLIASSTRNRETTRLLLEAQARVDVRDSKGMSPLHRCQSKEGGVFTAKLLLKHALATNPSIRAAQPEFIDMRDSSGRTALYMACEKGNEKMVRFLLEQGANPDLTDSYGKTALYMACERGDDKMIRCLLDHNVGINIQGPGLCTPLIAAIQAPGGVAAKLAIVEKLLAHGANAYIADADGQNAFSAAKQARFSTQIRRLLQQSDGRRLSSTSGGTCGSAGCYSSSRSRIESTGSVQALRRS